MALSGLVAALGLFGVTSQVIRDNPDGPDMTTTKTLVLTRPEASAKAFLQDLQNASGDKLTVINAPIMQIIGAQDWPDLSELDNLIITSSHAVRGRLDGKNVFCVGVRTAAAAEAAGGNVIHCAPDADRLVKWLHTEPRLRAALYLRGSHVATNMRDVLNAMGFQCSDVVTYAQEALPLSSAAKRAIEGEQPAILPLFSPRSARLVGGAIAQPGPNLHVISISAAAAKAWQETTGGSSDVVEDPTGDAMLKAVITAISL